MCHVHRSIVWFAALVLLACACAGPQPPTSTQRGAVVPITDLKTVAGTWAGLALRQPADSGDWLEITLRADGTFQGVSARQVGVFMGQGTLQLRDGNVLAVGPRGTAVMTLYERRGPLLSIDFTESNGVRYSAELRPKT